jgi:hypothetical protein
MNIIKYYFHLINVISFTQSQSGPINWLQQSLNYYLSTERNFSRMFAIYY